MTSMRKEDRNPVFARNVQIRMVAMGLTMSQLAENLGISVGFLSRRLSENSLNWWAQALVTRPEALLSTDPKGPLTDPLPPPDYATRVHPSTVSVDFEEYSRKAWGSWTEIEETEAT